MATAPLFVADLDTLKDKLRFTNLPSDSAALPLLNEAILSARLAFYRRLGDTRTNALAATSFVENPASAAQVLRAIANTTEVKMVRVRVMRTLPVLFQDASGGALKEWNEEAPFREAGMSSLDMEIKRLEDEIEEDMQILEGEEDQGAERAWRVFDGTRDCAAPQIGDSLLKNPKSRNTPFLG
jgi:hypothetical protein